MTNVISFDLAKPAAKTADNVVSFGSAKAVQEASSNLTFQRGGLPDSRLSYDDVMFPVESRPLECEGQIIESHKAIWRPDTETPIAVVGAGYKILHNSEIFGAFDEALKHSDLNLTGMTKTVDVAKNGQKTFIRYRLPEHTVSVGRQGDKTQMEFCAINSYDGSTSFTAFMGGYRLLCSNGQILGDHLSFVRGRHTANLSIEHTADRLRIAAEKFDEVRDEWDRWTSIFVTTEDAREILLQAKFGERLIEKIIYQYEVESIELGFTKWALYNALTAFSTHATTNKGSEDNAPAIRYRREGDVQRVLKSAKWKKAA